MNEEKRNEDKDMADEKKKVEEEEDIEDNVFTLTDEDGNDSEFEYLGDMEIDGQRYMALVPLDEDSEDDIFVVLKVTKDENGEELLETIDDDDEFNRVAAAFEDQFMGEADLDQ